MQFGPTLYSYLRCFENPGINQDEIPNSENIVMVLTENVLNLYVGLGSADISTI